MVRAPEIKKQAEMLRGFFAEQGITLTHRQSLDRVARLHGHPSWHVMEKYLRAASKPNSSPDAAQVDPSREVAIVWSFYDVQTIRPDLTDAECLDVLHTVKHNHDANEGITWNVIEMATNHYPTWSIEAEFQAEDSAEWTTVTVILSNGEVIEVSREEYITSDENLDFISESRNGTLRFREMPAELFEVLEGRLVSGFSDQLAQVCTQLRTAGVSNDGRQKPRSTGDWSWND